MNDQKMWTAIAGSKNETMHCPVAILQKPGKSLGQHGREDVRRLQDERPKPPVTLVSEAPTEGHQLSSLSTAEARIETSDGTDMEGARLAVAALQGVWESQRDSSETYWVQGLDVTRHQRQSNGAVAWFAEGDDVTMFYFGLTKGLLGILFCIF